MFVWYDRGMHLDGTVVKLFMSEAVASGDSWCNHVQKATTL